MAKETYKSTQVFTPNSVPTITYVDRKTNDLESKLRAALRTPGQITSISGPSKTGKTVLVKKIIERDNIISVSGGSINSAEHLWIRVLNWMGASIEMSKTSNDAQANQIGGKSSAEVKVPLVAGGVVEASGSMTHTSGSAVSTKFSRTPIDQVVHEIADSSFTIFVDDYHYMAKDVRNDVAKQIKEVSEKGVRVCTASVPHRADDVVRSNPELRGRVQAVDVGFWSDVELRQIAQRGFEALEIEIDDDIIDNFVKEAFGSPQLMQSMCLQTCFLLDVEETLGARALKKLPSNDIAKVLERTSTTTDFSTVLEVMHAGPKLRGQDRNQYDLKDGSKGDVYRAVLLALKSEPPVLSLRYDEIMLRVRQCCISEPPVGSSIAEALRQMDALSKQKQDDPVIEWSEDVLDIADPYFLFYIRCSELFNRLKSPSKKL